MMHDSAASAYAKAPARPRGISRCRARRSRPTTVALTLLLVVLTAATVSRLAVAIVTAIVAMFAFNYFFLPPAGTLTIAHPQNWIAVAAFLAAAIIVSRLSSAAQDRARDAGESPRGGAPCERTSGRVPTHRTILKAIWGPNAVGQPEHLRVLVGSLRKKIEIDAAQPRYILTEPWVGYRFAANGSEPA